MGFPGGLAVKILLAMQETQETQVRSLSQEDLLGEEMALQYSCLKNPTDRGGWQATVHGGPKESDMTEHKNIYIDINIYGYRLDRQMIDKQTDAALRDYLTQL